MYYVHNACMLWVLVLQGYVFNGTLALLALSGIPNLLLPSHAFSKITSPHLDSLKCFFNTCRLWGILNFPSLLSDEFLSRTFEELSSEFCAQRKFLFSLRRWLTGWKEAFLGLECLKTYSRNCGFILVLILVPELCVQYRPVCKNSRYASWYLWQKEVFFLSAALGAKQLGSVSAPQAPAVCFHPARALPVWLPYLEAQNVIR